MNSLLAIIGIVLLPIVTFGMVIALAIYRSVLGLAAPVGEVQATELPEDSPELESIARTDEWASANGFEWVGAYRTAFPNNPPISVGAWRRADGTYLTHYRHPGGTGHDLVSILDEPTFSGLTTTTSAGVRIFPRPEHAWAQTFPGASLDELLGYHHDGLGFIAARTGRRPVRTSVRFEDEVTGNLREQARHTREHALWPVRGVCWYLRRKRLDGIPVHRQRHSRRTGPRV